MFDTLVSGGELVDGTGAPPFVADIGIRGGRIAAIGDLSSASAAERIDASGRTVFEPHNKVKGDVARALLYFFTRYADNYRASGDYSWNPANPRATA